MIIRSAALSDIQAIADMANDQADLWMPLLVADYTKIRKVVTASISSAQHFCWVAEEGKKVVGVLIGLTNDNVWAKKQNTSIALWVSKRPGAGIKLLRKFREWVCARPAIAVAGITLEIQTDPRISGMLTRCGFKQSGGSHLLFKD